MEHRPVPGSPRAREHGLRGRAAAGAEGESSREGAQSRADTSGMVRPVRHSLIRAPTEKKTSRSEENCSCITDRQPGGSGGVSSLAGRYARGNSRWSGTGSEPNSISQPIYRIPPLHSRHGVADYHGAPPAAFVAGATGP